MFQAEQRVNTQLPGSSRGIWGTLGHFVLVKGKQRGTAGGGAGPSRHLGISLCALEPLEAITQRGDVVMCYVLDELLCKMNLKRQLVWD